MIPEQSLELPLAGEGCGLVNWLMQQGGLSCQVSCLGNISGAGQEVSLMGFGHIGSDAEDRGNVYWWFCRVPGLSRSLCPSSVTDLDFSPGDSESVSSSGPEGVVTPGPVTILAKYVISEKTAL